MHVAVSEKSTLPQVHLNVPQSFVSVAMIGFGQWGSRVILPQLLSSKSMHCIKEILIVDHEPTVKPAEYGEAIQLIDSSETEKLLQRTDIEAVIVATPDDTHYALTKAALLAGKHVFVEKCFVRDTEQARELVQLADSHDLCLMVGYEYMYDYRFMALKKLLDSGKLGKILEIDLYLINRYVAGSSRPWGDASIIEHHTSHQFSILQLLLGQYIPENIVIDEAQDKYVRLAFRYRGIDIHLTTAIDYNSEENYRHIKIRGSRFNVSLDFDGQEAGFSLQFSGSHEDIEMSNPSYPEELSRIQPEACIESEFKQFFCSLREKDVPVSGGVNAVHMLELTNLFNSHYQMCYATERVRQRQYAENYYQAINKEIIKLQQEMDDTAVAPEQLMHLVDDTVNLLRHKPFIYAREICQQLNIPSEQLKQVYKIIQRSGPLQHALRQDAHYDYFGVVNAFFTHNQYEATFFVGISCTYKCSFCKWMMTAQPVPDGTPRFEYRKSDLLTPKNVERILDDLQEINRNGKNVTVKISGGLEPLTDMRRVEAIAEGAIKRGLPVKLYSNGTLINSQEKRDLLLQFSDIRVSLNAINEKKYREIYLDSSTGKRSRITLSKLIGLLERLIQDKHHFDSQTRVGFNFVVIRETIEDMEKMALLAQRIGLDYVNYNIDYFDHFSDKEFIAIGENIKKIQQLSKHHKLEGLHVNFGGSLLRENAFSNKPEGGFDPSDIKHYKVFVDPAGFVSPVHEGTFAYRTSDNQVEDNPYTLGQINQQDNLADMLKLDNHLPDIGYEYLAPLELILALEIERLKQDEMLGFKLHHSPYHTRSAAIPI